VVQRIASAFILTWSYFNVTFLKAKKSRNDTYQTKTNDLIFGGLR
jgi:hypothetical protein